MRIAIVGCVASIVVGCGGGSSGSAAPVGADYTAFGTATAVTVTGYRGDAMEPFVSKDGRWLFFNNRNDSQVDTDLYYAARVDDLTFAFQGPVQGVASPSLDAVASLDQLGNFYFVSTRSYATTASTLYRGVFSSGTVSAVALVPGVSLQQPGIVNFDAEISADGQTLWFDDGHYSSTEGLQSTTIVVASRQADGSFVRRVDSATVLQAVNAAGLNYAPCISVDGLEIFFTHVDAITAGATPAIYRATRTSTDGAFGPPQRVAAATGFVEAPTLSADGRTLYFHKLDGSTYHLYRVVR